MSINRQLDNIFTFKNYQSLEVKKTVNGKFYQFCHSMEVGENYMIYNTHNPAAVNGDWDKRYKYLEIYSNNTNPFWDSPPGIGISWEIKRKNNNYYWELELCSYSSRNGCSEHNTDWKETQGDKLIYYEGTYGSIFLRPLTLSCEQTGYFKPLSFKWKKKTGTFKLKIEPIHLTDDCGKINQIEFMMYDNKFQKTISDIIERGDYMSLWFNKESRHPYIKRGKTGNKVTWITPYQLHGFEDYQWLKIKDASNYSKNDKNQSENYENWTKEQLINEIKKLKTEIEEIKATKVLNVCSRQVELEKRQEKLKELERRFNSRTPDNDASERNNKSSFPNFLIFGGVVLIMACLIAGMVLIIGKKRKR